MRRLRIASTSLVPFSFFLALASFAACGGGDDNVSPGGNADASTPIDSSGVDVTTTDSSTPNDASVRDTGTPPQDAAVDANDGGPPIDGVYVDVTNGHDGAPGDGTAAHPYQTISKAASVAVSGKTVVLANGTYPIAGAASLPVGVGIQAASQGNATLTSSSGGTLTFMGSGSLNGVVDNGLDLVVSTGTVTISGTQFTGFADPPGVNESAINILGTGHVVVTPNGLSNYITGTEASFAYLSGSATLEIDGGTFSGLTANSFNGSGAINANGTSQVTLDGVTVSNGLTAALLMQGSSTLVMKNNSLITNTDDSVGTVHGSIVLTGTPTVTIDGSSITHSPGYGIFGSGTTGGTITVKNGAIIDTSHSNAIYAPAAAIVLNAGHITNGTTDGLQIDMAQTLTTSSASSINGNLGNGIKVATTAGVISIFGTQIMNNSGNGISGNVSTTAAIDLGDATPGGNTIQNNLASGLNLTAANAAATNYSISAIGNTWNASTQTADATGKFPAATTLTATAGAPIPATVIVKPNVSLVESTGGGASFSVVLAP